MTPRAQPDAVAVAIREEYARRVAAGERPLYRDMGAMFNVQSQLARRIIIGAAYRDVGGPTFKPHGNADRKIDDARASELLADSAAKMSVLQLVAKYGLSKQSVRSIQHGDRYKKAIGQRIPKAAYKSISLEQRQRIVRAYLDCELTIKEIALSCGVGMSSVMRVVNEELAGAAE